MTYLSLVTRVLGIRRVGSGGQGQSAGSNRSRSRNRSLVVSPRFGVHHLTRNESNGVDLAGQRRHLKRGANMGEVPANFRQIAMQ